MSYCDFYCENEGERSSERRMELDRDAQLSASRVNKIKDCTEPSQIPALCREICLCNVDQLSVFYHDLCGLAEAMTIINEWEENQQGEEIKYLRLFSDFSRRAGKDLFKVKEELSEVPIKE